MATSLHGIRSKRNDSNMYFILTDTFPKGLKHGAAGIMCFISEEKYLTVFNEDVSPPGSLYVTLLDVGPWVKTVNVDVNIMQPLTKNQAELLYAVSDTAERLNCFLDKNALEDAQNAQLGQEVMVVVGEEMHPAIIRYIGNIHDSSPLKDMFFGVELQDSGQGKGRTNGTFKFKTYFTCKKDCGLFVPFNKIAFPSSKHHTQEENKLLTAHVAPVKPGDQVGFYFEDDIKHGTVVVLENQYPERFVHVSLDDGSKEPWKIPMDSVIKQDLLSPVLDKDDCMEIDNPKQNDMEPITGKTPEAGGFSVHSLGVNSMVQLNYSGNLVSGIIRWLGFLPDCSHYMAGVELDEEKGITDGTWKEHRYFDCAPRKGVFVKHKACQPDMRFHSSSSSLPKELDANLYTGGPESGPVLDNQPPLMNGTAVHVLMGRMKGIQGHCNSCYMDAALFSLFSCTSVLDSMLFKPPNPADAHIQNILRDEIVNPLRRNGFVSANSVMKLRRQLTKESQSPSFATSEKDPEEFLNLMMHHILTIEPLLKLQSGGQKEQECYCYQIFMEKQEDMVVPDVQQLVIHSFISSELKLAEIPSCFIIQMPRFGKEYKMFNKIIPSLELDITDLLLESPRECIICGELATLECTQCFKDPLFAHSLVKQYCDKCSKQAHNSSRRQGHKPMKLKHPAGFQSSRHTRTTRIPREKMELFAVLCIETSHYVSFVKYGPEKENWIFFDSMADRYGDDNGYNIPMVTLCPEVAKYLESPIADLAEKKPREMEGVAKRLFCDAYMYMYQSKKMSLYK